MQTMGGLLPRSFDQGIERMRTGFVTEPHGRGPIMGNYCNRSSAAAPPCVWKTSGLAYAPPPVPLPLAPTRSLTHPPHGLGGRQRRRDVVAEAVVEVDAGASLDAKRVGRHALFVGLNTLKHTRNTQKRHTGVVRRVRRHLLIGKKAYHGTSYQHSANQCHPIYCPSPLSLSLSRSMRLFLTRNEFTRLLVLSPLLGLRKFFLTPTPPVSPSPAAPPFPSSPWSPSAVPPLVSGWSGLASKSSSISSSSSSSPSRSTFFRREGGHRG